VKKIAIVAFRGELEEAAVSCRRALDVDPKGFAPNFHLARVLVQQSSYREAVPFLRVAIEARPDSGPAHWQLSIALVGIGDYSAAWEHVERAQELGREDSGAADGGAPAAAEAPLRRRRFYRR